MKMTNETYAAIIANYLLSIPKAFGYSFTEPTLWVSGTYNVPYADNRKLQSVPIARKWLRKALANLFTQKEIEKVKYIYGIPKAGIAPATLLALELNKLLLIKHEGKYYSIDLVKCASIFKNEAMTEFKDRVIVGTVPLGVPFGIVLAEKTGYPFLFVREKPKDHGKMKQVEGIARNGDWAILMNPSFLDFKGYEKDASDALSNEGIITSFTWNRDVSDLLTPVSEEELCNAWVIGTEDLVSTAKSSLGEMLQIQALGANILMCSNFNYGLPATKKSFGAHGIECRSVLMFQTLHQIMKYELNMINDDDYLKLIDWFNNQPNWGDLNNFPSKKKEEVKA